MEDEILESGFSRQDIVRLITQSLRGLGYHKSACLLEEESHVKLLAPAVLEFREAVLEGRWDDAVARIPALGINALDATDAVKLLILEHKFLELVDDRNFADALACLRRDMATLGPHGEDRTRRLASFLMCTEDGDLRKRCGWGSTGDAAEARATARRRLLDGLQELIPPSVLIPENRLETLLLQAMAAQAGTAPAARGGGGEKRPRWNLLEDSAPRHHEVPSHTHGVLDAHADEVWHVQFSHSGAFLASASKDGLAIIWSVARYADDGQGHAGVGSRGSSGSSPCSSEAEDSSEDVAQRSDVRVGRGGDGGGSARRGGDVVHVLAGHSEAVTCVAWSPDDTRLLSSSNDKTLRLWSPRSGQCSRVFARHGDAVTACAWLPDSEHFVSGGLDKCIFLWSTSGALLQSWQGLRVNDLAINRKGTRMLATCAEKRIRLYRLQQHLGRPKLTLADEQSIAESEPVTSACLSRDSRHVLMNTAAGEVQLWDLEEGTLVHRYRGQRQSRFVIRSAFGGHDEDYVVSGSEDSQVYIWSRSEGTLLEVLPGHSGTVNAVAWNPMHPSMFASASDDHTLRIWGPKTAQHGGPRRARGNGAAGYDGTGITESTINIQLRQ